MTLLLIPAGIGRAAADSGRSDVRLVYCLSDDHRDDLRAAAVRLGLVRTPAGLPSPPADRVEVPGGGVVLTLDQWAERRPADFDRVCDALMAAAGDPPGTTPDKGDSGGLGGFLDGAYLLAAGAVLTLAGQFTERISAERRTRTQQLTAAVREFRRITCQYLADYEDDPEADPGEALRARETLTGLLALAPGPSARREEARRLADELPLAERLPRSLDGNLLQPHQRKHEADTVRTALDRQVREVADVNRAAPVWWLHPGRASGRRTTPGGHRG